MSIERIVEEIKEKTEKKEYWDFKGKDNRDHVHSMLKYPAVMVPNMQGEIFDILLKNDNTIHNVLDPFMGSGTILVEGMIRGLDVCGVDINPLSYLLVLAKTQSYSLGILQKKSKELIERINQDTDNFCFSFEGINKWYNDEIIVQLSRIRRCIIQEPHIKYTISDDSIVLTESSYFQRLSFESPLDIKLRSDMLGKTILFVGYSLSDINIRLLIYKLDQLWKNSNASRRPKSYLFLPTPNPIQQKIFESRGIITIVGEKLNKKESTEEFLQSLL